MEGAPPGLQPADIKEDLVQHIMGLEEVHHVHTWSLTQERPLVTLHAQIQEDADPDELLQAVCKRLEQRFNVDHVTVQIEKAACGYSGPQ